jgi:tetratricopeptide (TPR) repeat protein
MSMSSVDRHSAVNVPGTDFASQSQPSLNQQAYLRLRLALSLNLRHQIFIAICDDVMLRDQLAAQLETDLASPAWDLTADPALQQSSPLLLGEQSGTFTPRLVGLRLNLDNPDIVGQITSWLSHPENPIQTTWVPHLQITGIDQLTRQPVHIQREFLSSLAVLAQQIPTLEFNILLWVNRPWCRTIQQSVPEFWHWHSAVFEFEDDLFEPHRIKQIQIQQPKPQIAASTKSPKLEEPANLESLKLEQPKLERPKVVAPPKPEPPKPKAPQQADPKLTTWVVTAVMKTVDSLAEQDLAEGIDENHPELEPLKLLQKIEILHQQDAPIEAVALTYRQLGDWYRDRIDPSHPSQQHLAIVIRSYERVLKLIDSKSEQVPDLLNDIGNLYWMKAKGRTDGFIPNLEKALKAYEFALERTDAIQQPQTYAMLQNNLGSVYNELAYHQDPSKNLQRAIEAYQKSLDYRSVETDAARYAATQNNLGTALWNLAQHQQPMLNLQRAIEAYNEALHYYNPEQEPLHYGMLQNNLGTAYWNLAQCEQATQELAMSEDFLRLAIGAYRVALVYRTLEVAPYAYAATQNNLGTAYWHLANHSSVPHDDQVNNLLCAIDAYQEALAAAQYLGVISAPNPPILSFDVYAAHYHIGLAYYQVATDPRISLESSQRSEFLKQSLQHQSEVAQGWHDKPDLQPNALNAMIQVVRALHDRDGIQGQTWAMSNVPAAYLSLIMKEL